MPITFGSIIDALGLRVTNVGTPTTGTDAANKAYVDAATGAVVFGVQDVNSTSTASIANTTVTQVAGWTGADASGLYTSGTTAGIHTFDVAGMFLFNVTVGWASVSSGRRALIIRKNSTEVRRTEVPPGAVAVQSLTHMMPMNAGDTFDVSVWQNSGSPLVLASPHEWQAWKVSNAIAYG